MAHAPLADLLLKFPLVVRAFTSQKSEIYAAVQYPGDYKPLGDLLGEWIQRALNERRELDFGKPLRWVIKKGIAWCPKCNRAREDEEWRYCPHCGQKLDPPEGGRDG